ncbi:lipase member H-like [Hyposmocoma kahamanoa]|uniref:lipase member H-like n=1 Tax=Hyposmocoma kahamanoa TaxID=1477025 RepID=UPI000E6D8688|nr:lipase member H-like [Hyposmocoma kahamanoa]
MAAGLKWCSLILLVAAVAAVPAPDPVLFKKNDGLRFQYYDDGEGNLHLVDQWFKVSDAKEAIMYNADTRNVYHLFTRQNPSQSQPMLLGQSTLLANSNFSPGRRTVFLVHGFTQSATSNVNAVLVPAFLEGEDVNVFVLDWNAVATNAGEAGESMARAIDWIVGETGTNIANFHLVGFSLGAHMAGVAGRNVQSGRIPYLTGLDPGAGMEDSGHILSPDAAIYTEAIHTNADIMGHGGLLAHSDFYPNGGDYQPGCGVNFVCNHYRSFFFFAETLTTTTGFLSRRCQTVVQARTGLCPIQTTIRMGGLMPKTGTSGIFHLTTNAEPPFGQ